MNGLEYVNSVFIERLNAGVIPWHRTWSASASAGAYSYATGKPYSMLNRWLLKYDGAYIGVSDAIKRKTDFKGVPTETIVWAAPYEKKLDEIDPDTGTNRVIKRFGYKMMRVLPAHLVKGLPEEPRGNINPDPYSVKDIDALVDAFVRKYGFALMQDNSITEPRFANNTISVPDISRFESNEAYYAALFRILVQSTNPSEDKPQRREITSEMGSAMLCSHFGIDTTQVLDNSLAYIQKMKKAFTQDSTLAYRCATGAERSVKTILESLPIC